MCGIIAVLRERDDRLALAPNPLFETFAAALAAIDGIDAGAPTLGRVLADSAARLAEIDQQLRSLPGVRLLVGDEIVRARLAAMAARAMAGATALEDALDAAEVSDGSARLESVNAALIALKDAAWAIERDRVRTADAIVGLAGSRLTDAAVPSLWSIQVALSAIDRLEVRGRDSAGIEVYVTGHGLDLAGAEVAGPLAERIADPLFRTGSVRIVGDALAFVYKTAAEIGELGDNTAALRSQITGDELLMSALGSAGSHAVVLGHTRWASIGIISEPNAHPLDSWELDDPSGPFVSAVLNGDVDNFADLKTQHSLSIASEITTDAKVIPTIVSQGLERGDGPFEAFRAAVSSFEGSVAIAAHTGVAPNALMLALRGSGQALYIGRGSGSYVVASEPYGVVEECDGYVRMDGETPSDPDNPVTSQGQIIILDGDAGGEATAIDRRSYDGTALPVLDSDVVIPEITTRDIDRGDLPHFLLKEIGEAPASFRKTLRGKIVERDGALSVRLGDDVVPSTVSERLTSGGITEIIAIGQGTAAVASRAVPAFLGPMVDGGNISVRSALATELSGFGLRDDMSNTVVVAVSQSGTTTDTNRTVDLVRARGASVLAIVNRRGSDLTDKADGVLYTSDGRDVEMSVASTKAFYAQVAAAALLSCALADAAGAAGDQTPLLRALRATPDAMRAVLDTRPAIAAAAAEHAPAKRYWALVGNGVNRIASTEIRIKLSELCYKAIPEDATEDKKHIDLSSEPLIVVCAAGLEGSTADDVAKEVAIYRAHKATPIVIASDGDARFSAATELLTVPAVHPALDFLLATMVGHLFGYEAALAIDAQARPLREIRSLVEGALTEGPVTDETLAALWSGVSAPAGRFFDGLRTGGYDGHLEASSALRTAVSLRYTLGLVPLESYQSETGKVGTPAAVIEDLMGALNRSIDELTRPVDAIKHQAKTVTVGISRSDETLTQSPLVRYALDSGAARDRLSYRALRTLVALDAAVDAPLGYTRYRIEGDVSDDATIQVIDRGGIARDIASRTDTNPELRGSKHRAAFEREVTVARGGDGRNVIHVPEVKDGQTVGLTLLHCRFHEQLPAPAMRAVLMGYRGRYGALKDAVTETEPSFRDDLLDDIEVVSLLTDPVYVLAAHWKT